MFFKNSDTESYGCMPAIIMFILLVLYSIFEWAFSIRHQFPTAPFIFLGAIFLIYIALRYRATLRVLEEVRAERLQKEKELQLIIEQERKANENNFEAGEIIFKSTNVHVIGTKYRDTEEIVKLYKNLNAESLYENTENVLLEKEPTNPADQHAIKVIVADAFIGYLKKDIAKQLNRYIDYENNKIKCIANIEVPKEYIETGIVKFPNVNLVIIISKK